MLIDNTLQAQDDFFLIVIAQYQAIVMVLYSPNHNVLSITSIVNAC